MIRRYEREVKRSGSRMAKVFNSILIYFQFPSINYQLIAVQYFSITSFPWFLADLPSQQETADERWRPILGVHSILISVWSLESLELALGARFGSFLWKKQIWSCHRWTVDLLPSGPPVAGKIFCEHHPSGDAVFFVQVFLWDAKCYELFFKTRSQFGGIRTACHSARYQIWHDLALPGNQELF